LIIIQLGREMKTTFEAPGTPGDEQVQVNREGNFPDNGKSSRAEK